MSELGVDFKKKLDNLPSNKSPIAVPTGFEFEAFSTASKEGYLLVRLTPKLEAFRERRQ
jgi:hypothetical protein